jgi:hypothetical protein
MARDPLLNSFVFFSGLLALYFDDKGLVFTIVFNLNQAQKIGCLPFLLHPCFVLEQPSPGFIVYLYFLVVQFLFPYSSPSSTTTILPCFIPPFK